jgi:integrase
MAKTFEEVAALKGGDVRLFVYTAHRKPVIYYRIHVPGIPGYEKKTTHQTDIAEATRIAISRYNALQYEVTQGRTGLPKSFAQVAEQYCTYLQKQVDGGVIKPTRLSGCRQFLNYTLLKFFGNIHIDKINEATIREYKEWRATLHKIDPGNRVAQFTRLGKAASGRIRRLGPVSDNTIRLELACVRMIFTYAVEHNLLDRTKIPQFRIGTKVANKRPAIDDNQMNKLETYMFKWMKEAEWQRLHHYRRTRMHALVMTLAGSGIRIGEARILKWRQVVARGNRIELLVDGKTRRRPVQPLPEVDITLNEWRIFQHLFFDKYPSDDDYIFCDYDGTTTNNFGQTFKQLITAAGFRTDPYGDPYTLYSLRHHYITAQLEASVSIYVIAANCGTGVDKIEKFYAHVKSDAARQQLDEGSAFKRRYTIPKP